ncbi:MAG: 1-acyl-sn-glycerol-3-phosphate acyltransferase [Spirochaetales bacterium]|nr:1-acyl-sn-glycerol-3-phosphate acyltransferase [Spirochaetales bacterium]
MKKVKLVLFHLWLYFINYLTKIFLFPFMYFKLNTRYYNLKAVWGTRGPYLLLPNHTNHWDPFIISTCTPIPVRWVASDAQFREAFKTILLMVGAIPKVKSQSDMVTLQGVKEAMALRQAAGIFPEGMQNWGGKTEELIPATAKLVRFLKVPVIVPLIKGGFLSKPRWSWQNRKCRVEVHFQRIISAEEIKTMKLAEIERRIKEALCHDDFEWQKTALAPIAGEQRAEHSELAHYACPSCEKIGNLRSQGNRLFCTCGYDVHVDQYGFFQYPQEGPSFKAPHEWISWQNRHMVELFRETLSNAQPGDDPVLLRDFDVTLMRGERARPMMPMHRGEVRLYRDRLEIGEEGTELFSIPIKEMTGGNTFKQNKFEFHYDRAQYRLRMPSRRISGYKWEIAVNGLRGILIERGEL